MLQMWSVCMLSQHKAPQTGIAAQRSLIWETVLWWSSKNSQLSEIRGGLNDSLDYILCTYTAVKIFINHVRILRKLSLNILGGKMKNSSYPGQLNLCNKQRIFHSNSYSTGWALFWQPICLCCSTQVQAFSIISFASIIICPHKAWKENLTSATSENHTCIPSLSSLTCSEMQGRPNSLVCVPAHKSYLSLEQFDHLCLEALPILRSCIPDFPSMLV